MDIRQNTLNILKDIPPGIKVVAATKGRTVEEIDQAVQAGIKILGENYVQDAAQKARYFKGEVEMHCIGALQSNKVKKAVQIFSLIQSVDTIKLAEEINKEATALGKKMPILLEVNSANEEGKAGCALENVPVYAAQLLKLPNIVFKGLMTLGPEKDPRQAFREVRREYEKLHVKNYSVDVLSMGMSSSYKIAIEEGANMVRIGTAIFGPRTEGP
ncbi:MAG: YggS family pyridoxal phosphate-dependent enzyme [Nanoarchaeota archaeon]|nr:YggS family pyridoxal phosphate-dependent enzyme [Nanoarchaeota archaeon]